MPPAFDFRSDGPDRLAWSSLKWERYRGRDIIPMWVADMDFAAPPPVCAALEAHARSGVFGYTLAPRDLPDIVGNYTRQHYGWEIDPDWLVWLPNLVTGINLAVRAVGAPGDAVATFTPIYPPFLQAPELQGRRLLAVPLAAAAMRYRIDDDALAAALTPGTRLLLLCHPHNPVGRVWRRDELERLAEIVLRHDLIVCSDEVHCDLILDAGLEHIPFASLGAEIAARTITLMSPSKTYNIAGLGTAFAVVAAPALRQRFRAATKRLVPEINALGYTAMRAALSDAEAWRQELLVCLRENRDLVAATMRALELPATGVEATYLAWFDARSIPDAHRHFEAHGVGLSDGADFGAPGFLRLNFGCPRRRLEEALRRLRQAVGVRTDDV